MKKTTVLAWSLALLLAGCASISKVEGEQVVGGRLVLRLEDAWNKVSLPGQKQPYETWTQEGLSLDQLRFWAGIKPGQALMALPPNTSSLGQKDPRVPTYTAGMAPDQLVTLFETMYAHDGSLVTIQKVEPASFAGERGVRFEFTVVRKRDDLQLGGVGWVSVRSGDLYAATFLAPRLAFYPRLLPKAETVVRSAAVKAS